MSTDNKISWLIIAIFFMFIFMMGMSLNPYFFGKCSTASLMEHQLRMLTIVLILIFLENALRQRQQNLMANYSHMS